MLTYSSHLSTLRGNFHLFEGSCANPASGKEILACNLALRAHKYMYAQLILFHCFLASFNFFI